MSDITAATSISAHHCTSLWNPFISFNSAGKITGDIDIVYILLREIGNLAEVVYAHLIEVFFDNRPDTVDLLQVVGLGLAVAEPQCLFGNLSTASGASS